MLLLAHRGLWYKPEERNTRSAICAAFAKGYGIETDVRDHMGELVIAHDVPDADLEPYRFPDLLEDYARAGMPGRLALNIKADGLASLLEAGLSAYPTAMDHCFVFDMSVPDLVHFCRRPIPYFTRHSEYESEPALMEQASGIWFDSFVNPQPDIARAAQAVSASLDAAIVSPELHGRAHLPAWTELRERLAPDEPGSGVMMLCTDFPEEAEAFFELREHGTDS